MAAVVESAAWGVWVRVLSWSGVRTIGGRLRQVSASKVRLAGAARARAGGMAATAARSMGEVKLRGGYLEVQSHMVW